MASNPSPHGHMHQHQFALQGTESKPCDAESLVPATLLIKHLPEAIPDVTLSRILANFGASSVRPCSTGRLRKVAFGRILCKSSKLWG